MEESVHVNGENAHSMSENSQFVRDCAHTGLKSAHGVKSSVHVLKESPQVHGESVYGLMTQLVEKFAARNKEKGRETFLSHVSSRDLVERRRRLAKRYRRLGFEVLLKKTGVYILPHLYNL